MVWRRESRTGKVPRRQVKRGDLSNKVTVEGLIAKDSSYIGSSCCGTVVTLCLLLCEMSVFWVNL